MQRIIPYYRPSYGRNRLWYWLGGGVLLAIAVLSATHIQWHQLSSEVSVQYAQWECTRFGRPSNWVALDEDAQRGAQLAKVPGYIWKTVYNQDTASRVGWWSFQYQPFMQLTGIAPSGSFVASHDLYQDSPGSSSFPLNNIVFLHGRQSAAGHVRLVAVNYFAGSGSFESLIFQLAPWGGHPTRVYPSSVEHRGDAHILDKSLADFTASPQSDLTRIYEGQPDEADQSHFTIEYKIGEKAGLIDGWLGDDEVVVLKPRYGPCTYPSEFYFRPGETVVAHTMRLLATKSEWDPDGKWTPSGARRVRKNLVGPPSVPGD